MNTNGISGASRDEYFKAAAKLLDNSAGIMADIMMSMGDGVSIQDRSLRIVYQNKFMIDNFGAHVGDYCYNVYEKRSVACDGCPILESYRTGQVTKALRVGITKEGVPFRFENIASVLRNEKGEIVAGIEMCRIVEDREKAFDELKKAMDQLKQTQNQLIRAEKLAGIGQLAAGMAHEINNPTMFIMSNLYVLRKYVAEFFSYIDSMEKMIREYRPIEPEMQRIQEEVRQIIETEDYHYLKSDLPRTIEESLCGLKRIKDIVSGMLEYASTDQSGRCMVDLNEEIESILLLLDNEIREKGQVVKCLGDLPKTFANSQQIRQMFINLIHNATQAIEPGGSITIKTEEKDNHIHIEISDSGVGIPANVIQNIFNPFFTTREVGKGVGLGLSMAYRIVENHNGNIDVQSELGQGTTFTIRLPIVSADSL